MPTQQRTRAFSLLEAAVVVTLCLVAAVAVTPRFAAAGDRALRDAMAEQVRTINAQVDAFRRDSAGAAPALGGSGAQGWASLIQGGYIANPPVNAYLGASEVVSTLAAPDLLQPGDTRSSAEAGWFYHPLRGLIVANGFDQVRAVFHDESGYDPASFAW